jgi:transcriptional regulator with XRE-family HTH domain
MAGREDGFASIDKNIAANVRAYREAGNLSQEELAQRMADRGFGFTQATIWKIESGQRPLKASELLALADALGGVQLPPTDLTVNPDFARHDARLSEAHRAAAAAYRSLKQAATGYLEAQIQLLFEIHNAREAGVAPRLFQTTYLEVPPEEAVIEARVDSAHEDFHAAQKVESVVKVLDALRAAGYKGTLSLDDIEVHDSGLVEFNVHQPQEATPPQPGGTS